MVAETFRRKEVDLLIDRLSEFPRTLIFIGGPRQVGKTTLVRSALEQHAARFSGRNAKPYTYVAVDLPDASSSAMTLMEEAVNVYDQAGSPRDVPWLVEQWQRARAAARNSGDGHVLVLDEIQKVSRWSEAVKGLWDTDRAEGLNLHVVLLGSSPLLMQKGMSESLAGRYELMRITHWSYTEMQEAFDYDLDDFLYFGGYPGSAAYIRDEPRWRNYVSGSLIEPSIEKDILMMTRVDKPALLKHVFHLGCNYSGQILSYTKMQGQLQDAGNTVTLAHYLDLLGNAGMIAGLQKYAGQKHRQRASSPKLNVLNSALMTAGSGYTKAEAKADRSYWGRVVESAVGAHLYNSGCPDCQLYYWREGAREVDFVIQGKRKLTAIEVKSGPSTGHAGGLEVFEKDFGGCRKLLVGEGGIPLAEFLSYPAEHWL